jgi:hypothetical protein
MMYRDDMVWCDGCGVEITWGPVVVDNRVYCCHDCSQGYACTCGERMELDEEIRSSGAESALAQTGYQV